MSGFVLLHRDVFKACADFEIPARHEVGAVASPTAGWTDGRGVESRDRTKDGTRNKDGGDGEDTSEVSAERRYEIDAKGTTT